MITVTMMLKIMAPKELLGLRVAPMGIRRVFNESSPLKEAEVLGGAGKGKRLSVFIVSGFRTGAVAIPCSCKTLSSSSGITSHLSSFNPCCQ